MPDNDGSSREPHEFTIYPDNRAANQYPQLEAYRQRSFTGPYCIPASLADKKCSILGAQGLLDELNDVMGTSFLLSVSLKRQLVACISQDYDFGLAYSYFRPHWHSEHDISTVTQWMDVARSNDAAMRRDALDPSKKYITNTKLPPRRVWDLYSNRVIPYYWWGGPLDDIYPVSHAWLAAHGRSDTWTSINGHGWPVPVPNDSSLERVRIEILNIRSHWFQTEYSWVDVLCLVRQIGEERHELERLEEWETDVPTIGSLYSRKGKGSALVYFSGLGRAFHNGGYDSPRHWFNRAWTVQEAVQYPSLGGATLVSPNPDTQSPIPELQEFYSHFNRAFRNLSMIYPIVPLFSRAISVMRERYATSELDRISGLVSLARPKRFPIYDPKQSSEEAWGVLVRAISARARAHLFFWYPMAGNVGSSHVPSWLQVMSWGIPAADIAIEGHYKIRYDETRETFHGSGFRILNKCLILGFGPNSVGGSSIHSAVRMGRILVEDPRNGRWPQFQVAASHQVSIDETIAYTLLMAHQGGRLVVAIRNDAGQLRKLCVLDLWDEGSARNLVDIALKEDVVLI